MAKEDEFEESITGSRHRGSAAGGRIVGLGIVGVITAVVLAWTVYSSFRIEVPTGRIAVLIKKTGKDIRNKDEIAPDESYKGVQRALLTEGRYFYNPYIWEWKVIDQTEIDNGQLGVLISMTGDDLPYGEFLAKIDPATNLPTKGIMPDVLRPGRHPIHPGLFAVEMHAPVTVPAGYKGVVTNLAGRFPVDPNRLLVDAGERGVQPEALDPGTYYLNPYVQRVSQVDCRSQRFNLAENKDMGFPSKDGFWVTLDGIIEFRVNPEKVADVYVTYNEDGNGEEIDEEIINKVILPNARSFCRLQGSNEVGREFISGGTRKLFQDNFQIAMKEACEPLGVEIIQALITRINPPQQIAKPVREREIAKQQEKQFREQIEQQKAEQNLRIEAELVKQRQALVKADQEVVTMTTQALREQEVALTKAREQKAVAEFQLRAAEDKTSAILALGKAEADVVKFQNEAAAAGWRRSVEAFSGNGRAFAEFVMFEKLASAYKKIMINTADSPLMKIFEPTSTDGDSQLAIPATTSPGPAASPGLPSAATAANPTDGQ